MNCRDGSCPAQPIPSSPFLWAPGVMGARFGHPSHAENKAVFLHRRVAENGAPHFFVRRITDKNNGAVRRQDPLGILALKR